MKPKKRSEAAKAILPDLPIKSRDKEEPVQRPELSVEDQHLKMQMQVALRDLLAEKPQYIDPRRKEFIVDFAMQRYKEVERFKEGLTTPRKAVRFVLGQFDLAAEAGWDLNPMRLDGDDYDPDDPF